MENFRDLVNGEGCDEGSQGNGARNPLTRFVDSMYRDRSQREHQEYNYREDPQNLNFRHDQRLNTQRGGDMRQVQNFLSGYENKQMGALDPLGAFEEGKFEEFEEIYSNRHGGETFGAPPLSPGVPPDLLQDYIKSFIHSQHSQERFGARGVPDLGLLPMETAKVKDRSSVLARHMFPRNFLDSFLLFLEQPLTLEQDFAESQVESFMQPFLRGMRTQGVHPSPLERERYLPEGEMDRIFQESQQSHAMLRDFEEFQSHQNMEQYYREVQETEKWVDEFEGRRTIEKVGGGSLQELTRSITEIDDPKLQQTQFMRLMQKMSKGQVDFVDNQLIDRSKDEVFDPDQLAEEFSSTSFLENAEKWDLDSEDLAAEFEREREGNVYNWLSQYEHLDNETEEWLKEYSGASGGGLTHYEFTPAEENPYLNIANPFQKGLELFEEGRLSQAVLAFEAELLRHGDNYTCWKYLGQTHAENDKDAKAISCLLKATESESHLDALPSLAVSYTNDLYRDRALDTLRGWISTHPQYKSLEQTVPPPPEEFESPQEQFHRNHSQVTNLFIQAARLRPHDPDPDVQTALGLLFNLSNEYDKAVDCFKAALQVRPKDYLLWNKLGATLANSSRSEEALGCYFKALEIKPSYVRARANLGISFMALRDYDKAAEYFLGALSMHPQAVHIWTNLQMVFMSQQKDALVQLSAKRDLDAFRKYFDF